MVYKAGGGSETIDTTPEEQNSWALTDDQVMDIEWCVDGDDGKPYIVQARPETVASQKKVGVLEEYKLEEKGTVSLAEGRAVGRRIGAGKVNILKSIDEMSAFKEGQVLVADMTDPDW